MAPKRRSARAATSRQSTIAFHGHSNKVTKPSTVPPSKKTPKDSAHIEAVKVADVKAETPEDSDVDAHATEEAAVIEQAQVEAVAPVTAEEEEANNVSDTQIEKYWQRKEQERKAPRVHQEDVPLFERVCREWDTDGRYGVS
jgi:DNA polymerase delta subunit 4